MRIGVGVRTFDPAALRRHLAERGMTLTAVAAKLAVPRSSVSGWAHGKHAPSPKHLLDLARALGVAPQALTVVDPATAELYDLRVWAGRSIRSVGAAAGLPWQSYAAIEAGTRPPPTGERLQQLATALSSSTATVQAAAARTWTRRGPARP